MARSLKHVVVLSIAGLAVCGLGMVLAAAAIGYQGAHDSAFDIDQALFRAAVVFAIAIMAWAMAVSVGWMRSIDETAREAHKSAWLWGGCGGLAVGGVFIVLASLPQAATFQPPTLLQGRTDATAYAATGALGLMLLMVAGYSIAWALWWLKRR